MYFSGEPTSRLDSCLRLFSTSPIWELYFLPSARIIKVFFGQECLHSKELIHIVTADSEKDASTQSG